LIISFEIQKYSIQKEISADDDPLPIGQVTSNSLDVVMNNLPIIINNADPSNYSNNDDIVIFNNDSITSPITELLQKDCQCFLYLNVFGTRVPQFTGYINDWSISENDATAKAYDVIKIFQDRNLPALKTTVTNCPVNLAIELTLRNSGINDFNLNSIKNLLFTDQYKDNKIKYFWIENGENAADCLNDIAKIYQALIYVDEYGKIIIDSLNGIIKTVINSGSTSDFTISDKSTVTDLASIVSFSEITRPVPKKFTLNYGLASLPTLNTGSIQLNNSTPIWQPDSETIALSNVELAQPLNAGDTSMYITSIDTFLNGLYDYNGYFIIDREIIYYDGIEHNVSFTKANDPKRYLYNGFGKITIHSQEELAYYQNLIISEALETYGYTISGVSITPNNVLKNLRRGMFGTKEVDHDNSSNIDGTVYNLNDTNFDILGNSLTTNGNIINFIQYNINSGGAPVSIASRLQASTPSIFIPSNKILQIPIQFKNNGWTYFRTIQKLYNPSSNSRIFTGIKIGEMNGGNEIVIAAGRSSSTKDQNCIIVKPLGEFGQEYFLDENDFGTNFINTAGPLSEAIKFEVFLKNNSVKIFINDTLITSSIVFSNITDSPYKNVKFDSDDYLILSGNKTHGVGIFTWQSNTSTVTGTNLYEISVSKNNSKISYLGVNDTNNKEEEVLINNVLDNLDTNSLNAEYNISNSFYYWTGTKNARQLKIFDVDIDQIPIRPAYNKIFLGNFSYNISALKNNYI
jgi:hypothetical protein